MNSLSHYKAALFRLALNLMKCLVAEQTQYFNIFFNLCETSTIKNSISMVRKLAKVRYILLMPKTFERRIESAVGITLLFCLFIPVKSEMVWQILLPSGVWRLLLVFLLACLMLKFIIGFPFNIYKSGKRYMKKLQLVPSDKTKPYKHFRPQRKPL